MNKDTQRSSVPTLLVAECGSSVYRCVYQCVRRILGRVVGSSYCNRLVNLEPRLFSTTATISKLIARLTLEFYW